MITWYKDNKLKIMFDKIPSVGTKNILPSMTEEQIDIARKKPLILRNKVFCRIVYKGMSYGFYIEKKL